MKPKGPSKPAARTITPKAVGRKVSADDVARMAQVSRSAVSRTFTPGASVAPQTRAKVLAAAQALGYRLQSATSQQNHGRPKRAAVVMANLFSPYFCHLYAMFEDELRQRGFDVVWRIVSDLALLDVTVGDMVDEQVDGIIVLSAVPGAAVRKKVVAAGISLVVMDRQDVVEGAALVWIDGPEIGRSIAQLMQKEGRSRPAAIAANPRRLTELQAFAHAMEMGGSAPCRWVDTGWTYENGITAARVLFAGEDRPDAIFAASDYLAVGIVDVARKEFGLRVPEDVSVVGFGDTSQSRWLSHATSSIHLPLLSLVQTAVSTMAGRLGPNVAPPPRIWLACDVIERETTLGLSFANNPAAIPQYAD
ncbi:DNA-binding LacI/PurR family transcriptional regulator [Novosphingobium sp. SG751A]|uniref:LacI family DNA-binding transcriptional regulator n=1 Tax=Novosphingobium sp. SG751A TaxID=2587000 RepID=UPI001554840A|nr:LacI family DNA-binding transcriptional regulator [Novosphingobium sp. SG751A]NOW45976.1 DNA-binding LacI/PurR family transcriptional regulator [Novosphingobium sp. SG751A]